jgi:hypothetical protein
MSEHKFHFDLDDFLDDLWPPVSSLAGLVFTSDEDFDRARAIVRRDPEAYLRAHPKQRFLVVRKTDVEHITSAGLGFEEIELLDPDTLSPEERNELDREMIFGEEVQRAMAEMLRGPERR